MQDQNIVMVCQQNWDISIATSAKNLAKELAKKNRVLYVNMPMDLNTLLRVGRDPEVQARTRTLLGQAESLVQAEPSLWVLTPRVLSLSINWLKSRKLFTKLNRWNSKNYAASIERATRAVGFDSYLLLQDGIIFQGLELKQLLRPQCSVYYLRDYTITVPYFQRHGPWVEARLLEQADAVVTNSYFINDYARQHNPHSYIIGQGYAQAMYRADQNHPLPADLASIPRPFIGYTGYLTALRLDIDLLVEIARRRPQWSLVLIGPEDEAFADSTLHGMPNVHFLGGKPPEQLASYVQHFDVCTNPQIVNDMTIGNYPLKMDEYLAMGKPVVATTTRAMELFAEYAYLATGPDEWVQEVEAALQDHDPAHAAARRAFAESHTWASCAEKIGEAVVRTGVMVS